jgi:hypothetical protein
MKDNSNILRKFPKDHNGLCLVYDLYTFDNLFRVLLKNNFDHEEALTFVLGNCSLSALVFQERIHNRRYKELSAKGEPGDNPSRITCLICGHG